MSLAVTSSQGSLRAIQSPKELILSVPLALAYAVPIAESSSPFMFSTKQACLSSLFIGMASAAEVGLTCLNDVAAGIPRMSFNSLTSCQLLKASRKLMNPGLPLTISIGRSSPFFINILAGFWFGLHPYLSSNSFISFPFRISYPVQLFLFMILVSVSRVSRSIFMVHKETLFASFRLFHISFVHVSITQVTSILLGSPVKVGIGSPSVL